MNANAQAAAPSQDPEFLYEFDREPIPKSRLLGPGHFAGAYAGEHVAATEFVIGVTFVNWGASVQDIFFGLVVGNLLAVLTWTFVCAPIAVDTRLTLYWYLQKIGGPRLTSIYNVVNALMYSIMAGCMITVSASAVRIPFGIAPQLNWYPTDFRFVIVVLAVRRGGRDPRRPRVQEAGDVRHSLLAMDVPDVHRRGNRGPARTVRVSRRRWLLRNGPRSGLVRPDPRWQRADGILEKSPRSLGSATSECTGLCRTWHYSASPARHPTVSTLRSACS